MKGTVKIGAAEAYSQQMKDQGYPVSPAAYEGLKSLEGQEIEVTGGEMKSFLGVLSDDFYIYSPLRLAFLAEDFEKPPQ